MIFFNRFGKKKRSSSIIVSKAKEFEIIFDEKTMRYKWSDILKIVAFKLDLITTDEICLLIDFKSSRIQLTESFEGWIEFINTMVVNFPEIDKEWESKIVKPPFDKNETVLYCIDKNVG